MRKAHLYCLVAALFLLVELSACDKKTTVSPISGRWWCMAWISDINHDGVPDSVDRRFEWLPGKGNDLLVINDDNTATEAVRLIDARFDSAMKLHVSLPADQHTITMAYEGQSPTTYKVRLDSPGYMIITYPDSGFQWHGTGYSWKIFRRD